MGLLRYKLHHQVQKVLLQHKLLCSVSRGYFQRFLSLAHLSTLQTELLYVFQLHCVPQVPALVLLLQYIHVRMFSVFIILYDLCEFYVLHYV